MKILEVVTDEVSSIKTLIEVLKEMLTEANFEFIRSKDDTKESDDNKTKDSDDDVDVDDVDVDLEDVDLEDVDLEDDSSSKKTKTKDKKSKDKKSKSKVKPKTKKNSDTYDEIEEELDTKDKSKDASAGTEAEKGGMRMTAVDTTKTVLINLKLYESKFTKFKCKKKKLTLGINLGSFFKFIKTIDKEDTLTLFQEHDNKHFLNIKADSADNSKDSAYELKLLELNKDKINIPAISFEAVVTINSQEFHKICREMKNFFLNRLI